MGKKIKIALIALFISVSGFGQQHMMFALASQFDFEPEADSLFVRFSEVGYYPTVDIKRAYNTAIDSMKVAGLWDKFDMVQVRRCEDSAASLLNIISRNFNATPVNNPTFEPNKYWTTNRTTQYINTGFNPTLGTKYTLNNSGWIISVTNGSENSYAFGAYVSSTSRVDLLLDNIGSNADVSVNGSLKAAVGLLNQLTIKDDWWGASRDRSDSISMFKSTSHVRTNNASGNIPNLLIHECRINGSTPYSNPQSEIIAFGSSYTQADFLKFREIWDDFFIDISSFVAENVKDNGAVGDGQTDDFSAIQTTIDENYFTKIGDNITDTFLISQPIYITSDKKIEINGVIKIKDMTTAAITDTIAPGDNSFTVDNVSGFAIGEVVVCYDDSSQVYYNVKRGYGGTISNIVGNVITLDVTNPGDEFNDSILSTRNAFVQHKQNTLNIVDAENVIITGTGIIDNNKANQSLNYAACVEVYPENWYSGQTLLVYRSTNIDISGITVQNGSYHNFTINGDSESSRSDYIRISDVNVLNSWCKGILFRWAHHTEIDNIYVSGSDWEDGIIWYTGCKYATANNVETVNCKRSGFRWNDNSTLTGVNTFADGLIANNITADSSGVRIQTKMAQLNNVYTKKMIIANDKVCTDIEINGLNIQNSNNLEQLYFLGAVNNIDINDLIIDNCTGTAIKVISNYGSPTGCPTNVSITGGGITNHTGSTTNIASGCESSITFTDFTGL